MRNVIRYGAAGLALAFVLATQPARAEMEVLESTVPEITAGAMLKDNANLKLPDGGSVRLLVKTAKGNSTKTLKGPYEGTAANYTEKRNWWKRLTTKRDEDAPVGASKKAR